MNDFIRKDRNKAAEWASKLLEQPFVIIDTETSGLGFEAEIVQIGILDQGGRVLLDCLIKPLHPERLLQVGSKGKSAYDIHGIHPDHLTYSPCWADLWPAIRVLLIHRHVVIYNLAYDWPLIEGACKRIDQPVPQPSALDCAMLRYAEYVGDWNDYHKSYRWQPLPAIEGETAHAAIADCKATLALIRRMGAITHHDH